MSKKPKSGKKPFPAVASKPSTYKQGPKHPAK